MAPAVHLRAVRDADLPIFFEYQGDPLATAMAGVPAHDPTAFAAHWTRIRADPTSHLRVLSS
jgi:hypothetical protein